MLCYRVHQDHVLFFYYITDILQRSYILKVNILITVPCSGSKAINLIFYSVILSNAVQEICGKYHWLDTSTGNKEIRFTIIEFYMLRTFGKPVKYLIAWVD